MDILETLREIAPSEQPTEQSIHFAPARLAQEISAQKASSNSSRKRLYWAGGLTAAAAAVTAGILVVANIFPGDSTTKPSLPPPPPTAATSVELLQQAANHSAAIDLDPGQYLKIEEVQQFLEYSIEDAATGELIPAGNRENAEAAFVTQRTTNLHVPADRDDEWVWDLRGEWSTPEAWGDRADEAIETWRLLDKGDTPELWRLPGGRDPENEENPDATIDNRAEYEQMPQIGRASCRERVEGRQAGE